MRQDEETDEANAQATNDEDDDTVIMDHNWEPANINDEDTVIMDWHGEGAPQIYESCFMCNGYYGPCYEDPICPICHSFLLVNPNLSQQHHKLFSTCLPEEKDDEDSGNDEPVEENDRSENSGNDPLVAMQDNNNENTPSHRVVNIEELPPEVMMLTLSYLDDLSMWAAALVNPRWKVIITKRVTTPEYWKGMVATRWPVYQAGAAPQDTDWFEVYSSLTRSSCCTKCLRQIATARPENGYDSHWRQRRLFNELKSLRMDPSDGIHARPIDKQMCHWMASIRGPHGSPYEGGIFFIYLYISLEYPVKPPVVRFITKIYHPNISRHGDIGLDLIRNNWSLVLTISKVLISVQSLLTDPVTDVCMEKEIGEIYANDRILYDDKARTWTWLYAMTQMIPHRTTDD